MLVLNEKNFIDLTAAGKVLVFFYREKGCSFCDDMKPVFEELEGDFLKAKYELGPTPDSITKGLVESFPTFAAYVDGKLVGVQAGAMPADKIAKTFENGFNEKKSEQVPLEKATLMQLIADEAFLIDQIAPIRVHLNAIQAEIKKRKELAGAL
jgi:thiol-disulfide isomerase/thioredoxin